MLFKIESLKVKEIEEKEHVTVTVRTESGNKITSTIPMEDIRAMQTLAMDVTKEIKKSLKEDIRQMELPDESQRGTRRK